MSRFSISSLHKLLHKLSHNIDDESGGEAEDSENGLRPPALSCSRAPSSVKGAPGFQPWSPGASAWRGWKLPGLHRNLIAALSTNLWPEDKGSILVNFCPFHRSVTRHKLLHPVLELPTHFHLISRPLISKLSLNHTQVKLTDKKLINPVLANFQNDPRIFD